MKQIRNCVFETNSSSTHSIAIPHTIDKPVNTIGFYFGEYGWEFEEVDPANYLYTGIYDAFDVVEAEKRIEKLKSILDSHNIAYTMAKPKLGSGGWLDNSFIDHSDELVPFIDELLNDEDKLIRYLTAGRVFTGNDNTDDDDKMSFVYREKPTYTVYNWKTHTEHTRKNPYYMGDDYDWYYKGN